MKRFLLISLVAFINICGVKVAEAEEILEIKKPYTKKDINRAYKNLSLKYHPDKNPNNKSWAEDMFKKLNEAYGLFKDRTEAEIEQMRRLDKDVVDIFEERFAREVNKAQKRRQWEEEQELNRKADEEQRKKRKIIEAHPEHQAVCQERVKGVQELLNDLEKSKRVDVPLPEDVVRKANNQKALGVILLMYVKKGNVEKVRELIQKGADVNFVDASKMSPLTAAKQSGNQEIIDILLPQGAVEYLS